MAPRPKHVLSVNELAKLVGVDVSTWRYHVSKGCPVPRSKADLGAWQERYALWRQQAQDTRTAKRRVMVNDEQTLAAKRQLVQLRAVLAQIDVNERYKALLKRDDVIQFVGLACNQVRNRLNAMVDKMTPRLENTSADYIREQLQHEVDSICDQFARSMGEEPPTTDQPDAATG